MTNENDSSKCGHACGKLEKELPKTLCLGVGESGGILSELDRLRYR